MKTLISGCYPKSPLRSDLATKARISRWKAKFSKCEIFEFYCHYNVFYQEANINDLENRHEDIPGKITISYQKDNWEKRKYKKQKNTEKMKSMRLRKSEKSEVEKNEITTNADIDISQRDFPMEFYHILEESTLNLKRKPYYDDNLKIFWLTIHSFGHKVFMYLKNP